MSGIVEHFQRWLKLGVSGFWGRRSDFYRDVARAIESKELLRDFVEGELAISLAPRTLDKSRAGGLLHMRAILDAGSFTLADVLIATMPQKDHMALGVLRHSPDQVEALLNLAKNVDEQSAMAKLVLKNFISPLLLLPVGFIFAYVLSSVSIPEFVKTAPPEIWTGFNYAVRISAETFAKFGPWVFGVISSAFSWWLFWGLSNLTSDWRYHAEGVTGTEKIVWNLIFPLRPMLQMYRDISGTKFLSDLSYLLKSGMLLQDALTTMAHDASPWMRKHLIKIIDHMRVYPGDHVGAFSQGVLSQFLAGRLHSAVRRDGGKFAQVLIGIGSQGQREAQEVLVQSSVKISAIILTMVLSVILFFYAGQGVIIKSIEEANSPAAVMRREAARKQQQIQEGDQHPKINSNP